MTQSNSANGPATKGITGTKRKSTDAEKPNEECPTPDVDTRSDKRPKTSLGHSASTASEDVRSDVSLIEQGNRKTKGLPFLPMRT